MKLYDSKSGTKKNLTEKNISIYLCGPTVYNYVHIGNIRSLITIDILVRYLKATKNNIKYALNITDVDDKIIERAKTEKKTEKQISSFYEKAYFDLFKKLNVERQTYNPRVTDNIPGIISYVEKLVKKNKAYIGKDGDVYFDINSVKKIYGSLSKQKIDMLIKDVRKDNNIKDKHNPLDFVLWKKTNTGVN
jgi:cysteinyl-tRNA synthetase